MKKRADGLYQKSVTLPNGKRKTFYGHSQAEITRKIAAFRFDAEQGRTFGEVADAWQERNAAEVRYKTAESHNAPVRRVKAFFEGVRLKDISSPDVAAFVRSIEAQGLSRRTVQLHLDVCRMIFDYAIGTGREIITNPCAAVSISPGLRQTSRGLPDQRDLDAIRAHKLDDRFSLLPFLLLYTGLRLGEALALRREDFDLAAGTISVTKKISWQPNQPVVDAFTKTAKGVRTVPLLGVLRDALPAWDGYLFGGEKPYTKVQFRKAWEKYAERTGVQCDRHSLRHEFVTLMYDAGLDAPDAAQITGHDVSVMQKTYLHIRDARQKKSAAKLDAYVSSTVSTQ